MQSEVLHTRYSDYWIEDGILFATYANNLVISIEIAKELVEERIKFSNGKTMPFLVDIRGLVSVDTSSRKYFSDKISHQYISAGALLVDSLISKLAGNIFITVDKPLLPTKLFTDRKKAIRWLSKYKK